MMVNLCVHAVERYMNQGFDLPKATRLAYHDLAGDYAFVIGRRGEDYLCAITKGSGLVVGLAENATCVSSDLPSILQLTRRVLRIGDGEMVILCADRVEIRRVEDGSLVEREAEIITESMEDAQKGGYDHFMLKEIHEQPRAVSELIHLLEDLPHTLHIVERMAGARQPLPGRLRLKLPRLHSRSFLLGLPGSAPCSAHFGAAVHCPGSPCLGA